MINPTLDPKIEKELLDILENKNIPIGSSAWKIRQEQVIKDIKSFLAKELERQRKEILDEQFAEMDSQSKVAKKNYSQGYNDALKGRGKAPHDTREGYCCACDYDLSTFHEKLKRQKKEIREKIEKMKVHQMLTQEQPDKGELFIKRDDILNLEVLKP